MTSDGLDRDRIGVAYVVHTFHMGGLERCISRLANHLDRRQFRPLIICLAKNSDAAGWIERDDVKFVELHKRPGNDPLIVRRFARALRAENVDVVHSHNWGTLVETSVARRLARVPVHVHAERGMEIEDIEIRGLRSRARGMAMRWALNRADAIVAVAESVRGRLYERCGKLRRPVDIIPNGVDPPRRHSVSPTREELRRRLGIDAATVVLGSVGRLVRVKDFPLAVRATAELVRAGEDVHLVLVGDGPERETIAGEAAREGIAARVHLVGQQSDLAAWHAAMDIYLNVSLNEGMSQSILEAMASGLALVVTDVGDNRPIVDGPSACGLVVLPGRADELAGALRQVVVDGALRARLAANAKNRFLEKYQVASMVAAYESLYARRMREHATTRGVG